MKKLFNKYIVLEMLCVILFAIIPAILGYYGGLLACFLMLVAYILGKSLEFSYKLYANKKLLYAFICIYCIFLINIVMTALGIYSRLNFDENSVKTFIKAFCFILSFVLLRVFGSSLKDFRWAVSKKQLLGTLVIGLVYVGITVTFDGFIFINQFKSDILQYALYIFVTLVLVAFLEEFICRGILVSALEGYQLAEWKINIIQAILFGVLHCGKYLDRGIGIALLITCYQTVIGYFFGKIYFKTRSLTPCIILHLIWNIV